MSDHREQPPGTPESIEQPHDSFFRRLMATPAVAAEMLRGWLPPPVAGGLDWSTLEPVQTDFVDEDLRQSQSDCLFLVRPAAASPDALPVYIYVLVEHQSTVDALMPLRMLRYMVRIWEQYVRTNENPRRLPAICPVVVYQGLRNWTVSAAFEDLVEIPPALEEILRRRTPSFFFDLVDLSNLDPKLARNLVAWVVSQGMIAARRGDAFILEFFNILPPEAVKWKEEQPWKAMLGNLLYYMVEVARDLTWEQMAEAAAKAGLGKEIYMGLVERTREEGREEGREAAARMIDLALVNRFRIIPGSMVPRLAKITEIKRLEALFQVALTAASLEEFVVALDAEIAQ